MICRLKSFGWKALEMLFLLLFLLFTIIFRFGAYLILCLHFNMFWQAPVGIVFSSSVATYFFLRQPGKDA
jgi:hypothetical protein